ncbi:hypothetical protein N658DRAFT_427192 [Parathielavia hyrcaniae]|uniref:C2H2-type domain-containing protein n=1 Tax=Parathielavia hyrcaniae TaxID=113614 RepID=A0AAN6PZD3_9PEZI|nr:hypothetical protein N658DRAFT_427192 [Parathielavia hyrcaniae]
MRDTQHHRHQHHQQEEEEGEQEEQEHDDSDTDSDELHKTRPNRWRGDPSTWRLWTEADRQTWTALENVRKEDLAVHLYNAFGLRRGFRVGPVADEDGSGETGWDPGRAWTAWPMKADEVPDDRLLPRTMDVNEPFTLRRDQEQPFAGCNLEEEISATILRYAKERFRQRDLHPNDGDVVVPSIEKGDAVATDGETGMSGTAGTPARDDETDPPHQKTRRKRRAASPKFTPVVSADDDRSYALLRPVARRILARLDDTLMILHNQRMAGVGHMSESSTSDEETDAEGVSEKPSPVRPKSPPVPKFRRGRPKKVQVPREGETEQEMLIRVAREGKRKLPTLSLADSETDLSRSRSRSRSLSKARRSVSVSSRASSRSSQSRSSFSSSENNMERLVKRWGLRDWRDVLGAAALAGFSPTVMARAAQRCATLFKEEMTLHTLHEHSTSDKVGLETTRYVPGGLLPSSSDDDDSEQELVQLRTVSRHSSARPGPSSPEPESETPASGRSRSRPRQVWLCPDRGCPRSVEGFTKTSNYERHVKAVHGIQEPDEPDLTEPEVAEAETTPKRRSRSGTPGASHFCHYPNCPRAIEGFAKRDKLARHLETVHGKRAADFTEDDEADSADEMDGGAHVDGFLQPIKIRKGWRGEDTTQRPARARKKARAGSEELDSAFF